MIKKAFVAFIVLLVFGLVLPSPTLAGRPPKWKPTSEAKITGALEGEWQEVQCEESSRRSCYSNPACNSYWLTITEDFIISGDFNLMGDHLGHLAVFDVGKPNNVTHSNMWFTFQIDGQSYTLRAVGEFTASKKFETFTFIPDLNSTPVITLTSDEDVVVAEGKPEFKVEGVKLDN